MLCLLGLASQIKAVFKISVGLKRQVAWSQAEWSCRLSGQAFLKNPPPYSCLLQHGINSSCHASQWSYQHAVLLCAWDLVLTCRQIHVYVGTAGKESSLLNKMSFCFTHIPCFQPLFLSGRTEMDAAFFFLSSPRLLQAARLYQ